MQVDCAMEQHRRAKISLKPMHPTKNSLRKLMTKAGRRRTLAHAKESEEEERAIAEKGFYLHPSPGSNNGDPPKLLPLFPLHSPKNSVSSSE